MVCVIRVNLKASVDRPVRECKNLQTACVHCREAQMHRCQQGLRPVAPDPVTSEVCSMPVRQAVGVLDGLDPF